MLVLKHKYTTMVSMVQLYLFPHQILTFAFMNPKVSRTESERQNLHFRNVHWFTFIAVNIHLVLGLSAMGLLIIYLPADKYNLIRELVGVVIMAILNEWKSANSYITGSSAGSARNAEAIRKVLDNTKPVGETEA